MHSVNMMFFILVGLPVVSITVIIVALISRGGRKKSAEQHADEEEQILREIHGDLTALRRRIENLEIIFDEKKREGRKP